jgi:CMD domain protein
MLTPNIIERLVGANENSPLAKAIAERAEIMALSQASHDAVIIPKDPGGLSHAERAALAERIARLSDSEELADHYHACLETAGGEEGLYVAANPQQAAYGDERFMAIIRFTDLVTQQPREATKQDIDTLKAAGISEPDIVRLTEVLAFVNYQLRVVAGFKIAGEMK